MAAEIIPKLIILGIGFFFYIGIDIIVPGIGGNTFPFKDMLAKQSNM